jgi:hypothetical protein
LHIVSISEDHTCASTNNVLGKKAIKGWVASRATEILKICVLHLRLIIFSVGGDVPVDNETLLGTDFVNFKIKSTQCFEGGHMDRVYVFIEISANIYIYI